MELRRIKDISEFSVAAEPKIGVFGSKKWLQVYGDELELVGIYRDAQQLSGGFFFTNARRKGIGMIKLPPYTPHCGFFYESSATNRASQSNNIQEVMTEVVTYLSQKKANLLILAFPSNVQALQRFIWNSYKVIPAYTYRLDLIKELEQLRENFDPKHRNAISKALKDGIVVKDTSDNEKSLSFFRHALQESGANVYEKELRNILLQFSDATNSFTLQAEKNGTPCGIVHCIYDAVSCYYLLGGVDKRSGLQGVNHLLVSESIARAKSLGCKVFDFEGSMLQGVEKFFRGFGPDLFPYFTVNKGSLWLEMMLKFYKRSTF